MNPSYIAFYDLDHTILADNSATHLIQEARKRGVMTPQRYRHAIWLSILYKLRIGNSAAMIVRMLTWLNGLEKEMIDGLCREVFRETIIHKIRPQILDSIARHRNQGGSVVLLSSASEPICIPVCEHLGMDDMICSSLESENGVLTGKLVGPLVYGQEKKKQLLAYCTSNGQDPLNAYYYGDSHTDQYVMEAVGHPVAVDPDRELLKIARDRQWSILLRSRA